MRIDHKRNKICKNETFETTISNMSNLPDSNKKWLLNGEGERGCG